MHCTCSRVLRLCFEKKESYVFVEEKGETCTGKGLFLMRGICTLDKLLQERTVDKR